jgi:hypothetical protein
MTPAGAFVVSWDSDGQDGDGAGIFARLFAAAGTPLGDEFAVNATTAGDQHYSSVAMDDAENFIVVWSGNGAGDDSGVFGRRFLSSTTFALSGRVFEDVDFAGTASGWDGGLSDHPLPGVDVELYTATGTYIVSTSTDASGAYTFTGLGDGSYRVRARSATLGDLDSPPARGFNGGVPGVWPYPLADMTWGHGTALVGGQNAAADDTEIADNAGPGDTIVTVSVAGGDVTGVDFGFSFELVTNESDDGLADDQRSRQGSLRQLIKNANAIAGENRSWFAIPGL